MLISHPRGAVCPVAQPGRRHFDASFYGEAHGQQGVPMPFDDWYLYPLTDVVGDIENKDAPIREDPSDLVP